MAECLLASLTGLAQCFEPKGHDYPHKMMRIDGSHYERRLKAREVITAANGEHFTGCECQQCYDAAEPWG